MSSHQYLEMLWPPTLTAEVQILRVFPRSPSTFALRVGLPHSKRQIQTEKKVGRKKRLHAYIHSMKACYRARHLMAVECQCFTPIAAGFDGGKLKSKDLKGNPATETISDVERVFLWPSSWHPSLAVCSPRFPGQTVGRCEPTGIREVDVLAMDAS